METRSAKSPRSARCSKGMEEIVLHAAGLPVEDGEWRLILRKHRTRAISFCMRREGEDSGAEEALKRRREEALVFLEKEALRELLKIKHEQLLMIEFGVLLDSSFTAFLQGFQEENERRRLAIEHGEPVYGPKQYPLDAWYFHLHRLRLNELARVLGGKGEVEKALLRLPVGRSALSLEGRRSVEEVLQFPG